MADLEHRIKELERKLARLMLDQHYVHTSKARTTEVDNLGTVNTQDLYASGGVAAEAHLMLKERTDAIDTPGSGWGRLIASTSCPYYKNDAGVIFGACVDRMWLPATAGMPSAGVPALTSVYAYPGYSLAATGTNYVDWVFSIPRSWCGRTIASYVFYSCDAVGSGNVYIVTETRQAMQSGLIPSAADDAIPATSGNLGQYYLRVVGNSHGYIISTSTVYKLMGVRMIRYGDNAADTYAGNIVLFGVEVIAY